MARITIPSDLKGKDAIEFVKKHKDALLSQKKMMAFKHSDPYSGSITLFAKKGGELKAFDTMGEDEDIEDGIVNVKVICNTALWMDSHSDVALPDCWAKTIEDRKGMILHLRDHVHTFDGEIGDVQDVYSMDMAWKELGVNKSGKTQVLVMDSNVMEDMDEKMYRRYKKKKVKQHSIGLQYVKIRLAINDEDCPNEYDVWKKWIDKIGNKDAVEAQGYFFAMQEIKLYENSAVIFGSNELTPTIETNTKEEPLVSTQPEPFDIDAYIKSLKIKL